MASPVLVESAPKINAALNLRVGDQTWESLSFGVLKNILVASKVEPLFVRLDPEKELAKFAPKPEAKPEPKVETVAENKTNEVISIDDFDKIKLLTGEIIGCKHHPDAKKLLVLQVKIGEETRQIVSGIAEFYQPDELIGKCVVVVSNLKEATIRGVTSKGMILCASSGKKLEVLETKNLPSGSEVN
jgi:methionyl-tRNA synthetase